MKGGRLLVVLVAALLLASCGTWSPSATSAASPPGKATQPLWPVDAGAFPFSGTAETSGDSSPATILPPRSAHDVGHRQTVVEWAVADATHFRVTIRRLEPILTSATTDFVANGDGLVSYEEGAASAQRLPLDGSPDAINALLNTGVMRPLARSVVGYLAAYTTAHKGVHASLVGQESMLGRTADVIEVHPVATFTDSTCTAASGGGQRCTTHRHSYGKARISLDDEHLIVLGVQFSGIPDRYGGNYEYRLTSVHFGVGPSASDLVYPPVPVQNSATGSGSSSEAVAIGSGWHAPPPFIDAGAPSTAKGVPYIPVSVTEEQDTLHDGPVGIAVVYAAKTPVTVQLPAGTVRVKGAYLYLQERIRHSAPPWEGTQTAAGGCTVWVGDFSDHVHWLGLTRGPVSVLISANSLNRAALIHYAATQLCGR